jgi:hypothetical protein
MNPLYFEFLKGFLYTGDYYRLEKAIDIIEKSTYSNAIKNNLQKFVGLTNECGLERMEKFYSYNSISKYITLLAELGVNPITLNNNCKFATLPNLIRHLRDVAEEKYFRKETN